MEQPKAYHTTEESNKKTYFWWHCSLIVIFIISTISAYIVLEWVSRIEAKGSDGIYRIFYHPCVMSWVVVLSHVLCGMVFLLIISCYRIGHVKKFIVNHNTLKVGLQTLTAGNVMFNPLVFLLPSVLYVVSILILVFGNYLHFYSSLEVMLGFEVFFTAVFSVILLNRKYKVRQWFGIVTSMFGMIIGGASNMVFQSNKDLAFNNQVISQVLTLIHFLTASMTWVLDEKCMLIYNAPPLLAVGYEGLFGIIILTACCIIFPFIEVGKHYMNNSRGSLEDPLDAFKKIENNTLIMVPIFLCLVCTCFVGYSGFNIKKELTSVNKVMLVPVQRVLIWWIRMTMGWKKFTIYKVIGYIIGLIGSFFYYDIIFLPIYIRLYSRIFKRFTGNNLNDPALRPPPKDFKDAPASEESVNVINFEITESD